MIAATEAIDLLVLSDRYPPYARGGAELSLHAMLREVALDQRVEVVSLCGSKGKVQRYEIEGVMVTELPNQADWPFVRQPSNRFNRFLLQSRLARPIARLAKRRALEQSGLFGDEELRQLGAWLKGQAKISGGISLDSQTFGDGYTRTKLGKLFAGVTVKHLHADNYRAICVADAVASASRTYLVRDNRFTCPRFDQSRCVGSRPCGLCDHACVTEDAPKAAKAQRRILTVNAAFRKAQLLQCDDIISTSRYMISTLDRFVPSARLKRLPNPIDDAGKVADTILGVPQEPGFNMVVVGMLNENKGQAQLIKAWKDFLPKHRDFQLHFAGRGPKIRKRLKQLADDFGLAEQMTLHGYLERAKLYNLIAESQLVLLPTVWAEPFGRVPLEAALVRRPVVAFNSGGLNENIIHGKTGFLCEVGDYEALGRYVSQLAHDPELCLRMGETAYETVTKNFDPHDLVPQLASIWNHRREQSDSAKSTVAAE